MKTLSKIANLFYDHYMSTDTIKDRMVFGTIFIFIGFLMLIYGYIIQKTMEETWLEMSINTFLFFFIFGLLFHLSIIVERRKITDNEKIIISIYPVTIIILVIFFSIFNLYPLVLFLTLLSVFFICLSIIINNIDKTEKVHFGLISLWGVAYYLFGRLIAIVFMLPAIGEKPLSIGFFISGLLLIPIIIFILSGMDKKRKLEEKIEEKEIQSTLILFMTFLGFAGHNGIIIMLLIALYYIIKNRRIRINIISSKNELEKLVKEFQSYKRDIFSELFNISRSKLIKDLFIFLFISSIIFFTSLSIVDFTNIYNYSGIILLGLALITIYYHINNRISINDVKYLLVTIIFALFILILIFERLDFFPYFNNYEFFPIGFIFFGLFIMGIFSLSKKWIKSKGFNGYLLNYNNIFKFIFYAVYIVFIIIIVIYIIIITIIISFYFPIGRIPIIWTMLLGLFLIVFVHPIGTVEILKCHNIYIKNYYLFFKKLIYKI